MCPTQKQMTLSDSLSGGLRIQRVHLQSNPSPSPAGRKRSSGTFTAQSKATECEGTTPHMLKSRRKMANRKSAPGLPSQASSSMRNQAPKSTRQLQPGTRQLSFLESPRRWSAMIRFLIRCAELLTARKRSTCATSPTPSTARYPRTQESRTE